MNSIGVSSRSPSPITTVPRIGSLLSSRRMASTAAWSAAISLPRPRRRAADTAARSVTRTISSERMRSNSCCGCTLIAAIVSFLGAGSGDSRDCPRRTIAGAERPRFADCHVFSMRINCGLPSITRSASTFASARRTASSVVA